jgi:hypothetical protein
MSLWRTQVSAKAGVPASIAAAPAIKTSLRMVSYPFFAALPHT